VITLTSPVRLTLRVRRCGQPTCPLYKQYRFRHAPDAHLAQAEAALLKSALPSWFFGTILAP
jgi:hypothetical protein